MTQLKLIKKEIERAKARAEDMVALNPVSFMAMAKMCEKFLSFIESMEKEHKGKTNPLFEECLANVDPAVRKEVNENIDKILEKEQENRGNFPETSSNFPKIKGWVARDYDSEIFFHCKKPQKFHEEGIEYWANGGYRFMIPKSLNGAFAELTTDEPIEVELTISRVSK